MNYGEPGLSWSEFHFYCRECGKHVTVQGVRPEVLLCSKCEENPVQKTTIEQFLEKFPDIPVTAQQVLAYQKVCRNQQTLPLNIWYGDALMLAFPHIVVGIERDGYAHS